MLNIERFVCNPFQENSYVVSDETKDGVIIDCGTFSKEERKAIIDYITNNKITIKHLLATHAQIDHNFGNNTIFEYLGIQPEVYYKDECLMNSLKEQAMSFCNYRLNYDFPSVGKYLKDDDNISFGSHKLTIIPTPGHTPGSVFYYCEDENIAFSGDTLFRMSIGRTDFDFGSYSDIQDSLMKISKVLPKDTVILPGHGPKTTIGEEIAMNPYINNIEL